MAMDDGRPTAAPRPGCDPPPPSSPQPAGRAAPTSGFLAISRRAGEAVWIGDAYVEVVAVQDGRVRLAIAAPDHVKIVRHEIEGRSAG